jgi:hypothetical protein
MLTYQLQDRFLHLDPGNTLTFPGQAEIKVHLGPPTVFGQSDAPSHVLVPGREQKVLWNGNTGHMTFQSTPSLELLEVIVQWPSARLELKGDVLRYERRCNNVEDLVASIQAFQYLFPALLNVDFPEAPYIVSISGRVDDVPFRWIHRYVEFPFTPVTADRLEQFIFSAVSHLIMVQEPSQRRLMASLRYFHVATRLLDAGSSIWEFMPECVLNLCKALQVLFGEKRDEIRAQLVQLDYSERDIEESFIPLLLLRNTLDVGHPRLAVLNSDQLKVLYSYLANVVRDFQHLFRRVFDKLKEGTYVVREPGDMRLNAAEQREFDCLIGSMASRLRPQRTQG